MRVKFTPNQQLINEIVDSNYGDMTMHQPLQAFPLRIISEKIDFPRGSPDYEIKKRLGDFDTRNVPLVIIFKMLPNGRYRRVSHLEGTFEIVDRFVTVQPETITIV